MSRRSFYLVPLLVLLLGACVGPRPLKDYNLARAAMEAAKAAEAPRHAPTYWSRAERAYQRAQTQFRANEFDKAKASFKEAKLFAERAENFTAIKVMSEGGL